MENPDQNDSDEIKDENYVARLRRLHKIRDNFDVAGPGISGNIIDGFAHNPSDTSE